MALLEAHATVRRSPGQVLHEQGARAPGIVVAPVQAQGGLVAGLGAVKVLAGAVLVPRQRVRVHEARLQLQRALEVAQRRLVLLRGPTWPLVRDESLIWNSCSACRKQRGAVSCSCGRPRLEQCLMKPLSKTSSHPEQL